ncbi:hypothetical protein EBM89_15970 [Cellulomonas triticagri]|uniref:ABC transporter permease n=1 Tax=Cellulomonas triticagri TaxID=2483352 RepID=A0A3M2J3E7_9CELL|nr:hypothetical protein EBM89_15970 [Cellulomonas triticagri]
MLGEARRDLVSGASRAGPWGLLLLVLTVLLCAADASAVLTLESRARTFVDTGGATHVLSSPGGVSGSACDALSGVGTVVASGALRTSSDRLALAATPRSPVTVSEVTPGFARLLDVTPRGEAATGLLLSEALADQVLAASAPQVATESGAATAVRGTYAWPRDGRLQALAYAALAPAPAAGTFDECWLTVWPPAEAATDLVTLALLPGAGASDVAVTQLNTSPGGAFDGETLFQQRETRWVTVIGAGAGALLGLVAVRVRRLELASARHCGVGRAGLVGQVGVETLAWSAVAAGTAWGLTILVVAGAGTEDLAAILLVTARPALAATVGCVLAAALATARIRERDVLRYFKDR